MKERAKSRMLTCPEDLNPSLKELAIGTGTNTKSLRRLPSLEKFEPSCAM